MAVRLVVADLVGTRIGEWVPLSEVSYDLDRSRPGTLKATVEPRGTRPTHPVALHVVVGDGVVHWSGIVWRVEPGATAEEPWAIEAVTLDALFTHSTIRGDQLFLQQDQAAIVRVLIQAALPTADLTLWTLDLPNTGIKRDYTVEGAKAPQLYKSLFEMADNINGFDLRFTGKLDGPRPREVHLLYPRDHRRTTTIAIRPGIRVTKWDDDWTWVANIVTTTGDNNLIYTEARAAIAGWPSMARQITYSGVVDYNTLVNKAKQYLNDHARPLIAAEVEASIGESMFDRIGEDVRVIEPDRHRDEVFQLVTVQVAWKGESRVEKWTLVQERAENA